MRRASMDGRSALCGSLVDLFKRALSVDVPDADTDLFESGVLDSLAFVELLLELERSFGITTSVDDLELDNFRTIESIATFIATHVAADETGQDWTLLKTKAG